MDSLKRILLIFVVVFGSATVVAVAGTVLFAYALSRADPFPAFMEEFAPKGVRSYEETRKAFSMFVIQAFPVGSDAEGATKLIADGGFQVQGSSTPNSVYMLWSRHAGPCSERYSIIIDRTVDGKIAKATGQLHPICL